MANNEQLTFTLSQLEQRIDALESRNAFQDDVIEQLNNEVTLHQENLAQLTYQIQLLMSRVKDMQGGAVGKLEDETPPPHY